VAVVGADADRSIVASVLSSMRQPGRNLAGALSLRGLTGLLAMSALVVSNDTGPLHIAGAVGAATVGIFWCGNLINAGAPFRRRHRPVLSWRLTCPVCGTNTIEARCEHDASFVADAPLADVRSQARSLLAEAGASSAGDRSFHS
jgi:ADP-heptose:LPS heptosyltransferase